MRHKELHIICWRLSIVIDTVLTYTIILVAIAAACSLHIANGIPGNIFTRRQSDDVH